MNMVVLRAAANPWTLENENITSSKGNRIHLPPVASEIFLYFGEVSSVIYDKHGSQYPNTSNQKYELSPPTPFLCSDKKIRSSTNK